MGRLAGRVAIVTGGAGGIGRATAIALAREGAQVVVADIDGDAATRVATEIGAAATAIRVDVSEEPDVVAMIAVAVDTFGRLDVLHNNAALTAPDVLARDTVVTAMSLDVWERTLAVNLRSQMLACKHAIPAMLASGGGAIVNMSSGAANIGDVTRLAYGVSKAGVQALTRYVAVAHGKQGIRANAIVPGLIMTPAVTAQVPADMLAFFAADTLTPHLGQPEDIAATVVFLASDDARYITGQMITVDGGSATHGAHYARTR
ncbi:MAG TPA: SDR family oxidoreductase [Candidatus Binatia bacterium]|jgi:NAD(P)-dependent dehydrogenase (short-subunit alcohol dehydrogenase family)|nr:SDR family oxidoreductase [Candidatus Binatia bacterium]